jgi:hypothetical protein
MGISTFQEPRVMMSAKFVWLLMLAHTVLSAPLDPIQDGACSRQIFVTPALSCQIVASICDIRYLVP